MMMFIRNASIHFHRENATVASWSGQLRGGDIGASACSCLLFDDLIRVVSRPVSLVKRLVPGSV